MFAVTCSFSVDWRSDMLLPPPPSRCPKILFAACLSCFYMQTLVRAIRDLTIEWLKARKYWPRQSETRHRFAPAVILWPDMAWVAPAAFKTNWKPNVFTCFGVPGRSPRLWAFSAFPQQLAGVTCRSFVLLLCFLKKLGAFPWDSCRTYWPCSQGHILRNVFCSLPLSINTRMKSFHKKVKTFSNMF